MKKIWRMLINVTNLHYLNDLTLYYLYYWIVGMSIASSEDKRCNIDYY
jgi:hypothetical protein